jgi:hypothetical protein
MCHLASSLGDDDTWWACDGWTGADFDSAGAVRVPGEEALLQFSVTTLAVTCHLGMSVFKLIDRELNV